MAATTEYYQFDKDYQGDYEKEALELYITMSDTTQLRVLKSSAPQETHTGFTLFLVAGWGSVVLGWEEVLLEAMHYFDIVYLETREKRSSRLTKRSKFGIDRMSSDIAETFLQLGLDEKKTILLGSCMGATIIAHGLAEKKYDPWLSVLIAPPPRFELPPLTRYLVPIAPVWIFELIKPLLKKWLKGKTESKEQAMKYIRVLEEAEGKKWKKVGKPIARPKYWHIFPKIQSRVLLIAAEKDKMHSAKITQKIRDMIPNAMYKDLGTNHNTHAPILVDTIREVIKELQSQEK